MGILTQFVGQFRDRTVDNDRLHRPLFSRHQQTDGRDPNDRKHRHARRSNDDLCDGDAAAESRLSLLSHMLHGISSETGNHAVSDAGATG
ncbi:MAG: hypothetical protein R3B91_14085 [Planctomycetaceae bacterium]